MGQIIVNHPTEKNRRYVCSSKKEAEELKARLNAEKAAVPAEPVVDAGAPAESPAQ